MNPKNHNRLPIVEVLEEYQQKCRCNLHVPGHKQGAIYQGWLREIARYDLTEVGDLDDLHQPEGAIQEAQDLAADAFGADKSWFLVGGTTAGVLSAILSLCKPGDKLLISRNSHQSVYHGCYLAGVQAICMEVDLDVPTQHEIPLTIERIKHYLSQHSDIKAVFLTSPTYYGATLPIQEIASLCHQYQLPLLIDEAHGAHLCFHRDFPKSALESGADLVVQSTHKMLPSFTMSSMLHIRGNRIDIERLSISLQMIQSSSPSYPLMASLDWARYLMVKEGRQRLQDLLFLLSTLRKRLQNLHYIKEHYVPTQDPLKMYLTAKRSITGYRLYEWLTKKGIYLELADANGVLAIFSIASTERDLQNFWETLEMLDQEIGNWEEEAIPTFPSPFLPAHVLDYQEIRRRKTEWMPLQDAVGKKAGKAIIPYPPGIPAILPGEVYTEQTQKWIEEIIASGARVRGVTFSSSLKVSVLK